MDALYMNRDLVVKWGAPRPRDHFPARIGHISFRPMIGSVRWLSIHKQMWKPSHGSWHFFLFWPCRPWPLHSLQTSLSEHSFDIRIAGLHPIALSLTTSSSPSHYSASDLSIDSLPLLSWIPPFSFTKQTKSKHAKVFSSTNRTLRGGHDQIIYPLASMLRYQAYWRNPGAIERIFDEVWKALVEPKKAFGLHFLFRLFFGTRRISTLLLLLILFASFSFRYMPQVDGVVLAHSDLEILQTSGRIMFDSPYCHFYITVKLLVWKPVKGSTLCTCPPLYTPSFSRSPPFFCYQQHKRHLWFLMVWSMLSSKRGTGH